MTTAFQPNVFQPNAFQVDGGVVGGHSYSITCNAGAYTYTGQAATITYAPAGAYTLNALAGSYTYTGQAATLLHSRLLDASAGSYAYSGQNAGVAYGRTLAEAFEQAARGMYALMVDPGGVEEQVGSEWRALADGAAVHQGARLRTNADGHVLLTFPDGSKVAIKAIRDGKTNDAVEFQEGGEFLEHRGALRSGEWLTLRSKLWPGSVALSTVRDRAGPSVVAAPTQA